MRDLLEPQRLTALHDAMEREIEAMDRGHSMTQSRNRNPERFDALRAALNDASCAIHRLNKVRNEGGGVEARPTHLRFRFIRELAHPPLT